MGLLKFALIPVALAVTVGVIGQVKPELFLMIPEIGFVPWAMTGNPMPPYFDQTPYVDGEFGKWVKDDDVIVACGSKSGTNWLLNIVHQIRVKGSDELPFVDPLITTPWIGFKHEPGETWEEQKVKLDTTMIGDTPLKEHWDNKAYPFRAFKSHFTPVGGEDPKSDFLPIKDFPKVKFIAMARNGQDVMASFAPFWDNHSPTFKKAWGGFPPNYSTNMAMLKDLLPSGLLGHLWFGYVKSWYPLRNEPNVLLLHYNDLKLDLEGGIKKIADFVGVELSNTEMAKVVEKSGFKWMKENDTLFAYQTWGHPTVETIMKGGTIINKGVSGRGKDFFKGEQGEEMLQLWNEAVSTSFKGKEDVLKWAMEGGAFD